ncbi:MAG: trypsin-like peptidase domain-containing protein [Bacteroidota bacterium]
MKRTLSTILAGTLGGVIAFAAFNYVSSGKETLFNSQAPVRFVSMPPVGEGGTAIDFTTAAANSVNAVVHVRTESIQQGYTDPWAYFFGGAPQNIPSQAAGSGVIVSDDGFIVTNNHVVSGATKVQVKLNNNEIYDAQVIGTDPSSDIALLKIDAKNLPFMPYGNSDQVKVGQWVLAVGNPFNLTSTVTAGIVSAKGRNIHILEGEPNSPIVPIESFIQTDAAVNPGNSGGALVGANGELIGINTAIASNTGSYAGYSFAIPVNLVKKVVNDLFEFGRVQRAFIGVNIRDLNRELVSEQNLTSYRGVYVTDVVKNGAAQKAGIHAEDVITKVGDVGVNNSTELMEQVGKYRPGDKVSVDLIRGGKNLQIPVTLQNQEGNLQLKAKVEEKRVELKDMDAEFSVANPEELSKLKLDNGVKVKQLNGGKLSEIGIRPGFIITRIDKEKVFKPQDIEAILNKKQGGVLIEGYYPNGMKAYYGFGL